MVGVLIVTHHTLAQAMLETIEMITGKHDFLDSLGLEADYDPEYFGNCIKEKLNQFKTRGFDEMLIILDLYGGTPCNQSVRLIKDWPIRLIVGMNLPMMLQITLMNKESSTLSQLCETALKYGKEGIFDVCGTLKLF